MHGRFYRISRPAWQTRTQPLLNADLTLMKRALVSASRQCRLAVQGLGVFNALVSGPGLLLTTDGRSSHANEDLGISVTSVNQRFITLGGHTHTLDCHEGNPALIFLDPRFNPESGRRGEPI